MTTLVYELSALHASGTGRGRPSTLADTVKRDQRTSFNQIVAFV